MTTITFTTSYNDTFTVEPAFGRYANGRLAIQFVDDEGPFSKLTTNLPDQHLNEGEVFVKHWAENEDLFDALLEFGWLEDTGREVASGFVSPRAMRLSGSLLEAYKVWAQG